MIKVLSLIDAISGGGAMVMYNLIKHLPQYEHLVVCPGFAAQTKEIGLPQMIKDAGISVSYTSSVHTKPVMREIEQKVIEFDPDIIINHWWRSSRIQRLNKFGKSRQVYDRAKTILVSHNNDPSPPGYDYYISVSKHNARFQKYANKERKQGSRNHRVIYNGIEVDRFDVPKDPIKDRFVIGRVSSLAKFKIPKDWIHFANKINIPNVVHMIVGDGERKVNLERDVEILGAQKKFVFPGEITNEVLPRMLAKFDMICYVTEKTEAFSLAMIEAMAAGLPIVTQNSGGMSEQIIHGNTGFLCNSRREIQYYCEQLGSDKNLLERMGKAAKERARMFTIDSMVQEYDRLFKELLDG